MPFFPEIQKTCHFTSIINWCLKVGYHKLNNITKITGEWTAIVDSSIRLGSNKILLVLSVPSEILKDISRPLTLADVEIIGLFIKESINSEVVSESIRNVFQKTGKPVQILTDGGRELIKSCNIHETIHTLDIGHFAANILKQIYSKNDQFKQLIDFSSSLSLKLRQTKAAWIIPPKLRIKARFQNISALAYWLKEAFQYYENHTEDCDELTRKLLYDNFKGHTFLKDFAQKFYADCQIINEVMRIVKYNGFSKQTFGQVMEILSSLPSDSQLRIKLEDYFNENISKLKSTKLENIILSSDVIESAFGKIKYILDKSPVRDFNKLSLLMPALVGIVNEQTIIQALNQVKIVDIKKWERDYLQQTIFAQKINQFSKVRNKKVTSKSANQKIIKVA